MVFALTPVQSAFATHDGEGARDINEAGDVCEGRDRGEFDDIANAETDDAAECLNDLGIAYGFTDGTYRPTNAITREQMASFLARKLMAADQFETAENYPEADYTDRDKIANAHIANVDLVTAEGIAEGKNDGSYGPGEPVTRAQMAAFIVRQMEAITGQTLAAQDDHFTDDDGNWSEENINILADHGIVEGDAAGNYNAGAPVTRGQMALFVARDIDALNNEYGITFTSLREDPVVGNQTVTERPELFNAQIVSTTTTTQATPDNEAGTVVEYVFDENVDLFAPTAALFHVYNADGTLADSGDEVVFVEGTTVRVRFDAVNTTAGAAELTLSTVDFGAVRDNDGLQNPEGDAPIGEETTETVGTAGITVSPDLLSVDNFRQAATAGFTAVDFTFDENAFVVDPAGFSLILINGLESDCTASTDTTAPSGGTVPGGSGTTTITVTCPTVGGTQPSATNVARGTVDSNTVQDAEGNSNVLQAADVANNGNTADPDLVSAEFRPSTTTPAGNDQVLYTFDEAVSTAIAGNFRVYDINATETGGTSVQINPNNATQVLVTFGVGTLSDAVGASVTDGAVLAADNGEANEQDEVGVQNEQTTGQAPGETAAPQLIDVTLDQGTDQFGNPTDFRAHYTFDEDVTVTTIGDFYLYEADGTRLTATNCTLGATEDTDNTVTCTEYTRAGVAATSAEIGAAVLGTVDDGAVTEEGGLLTNPEGAEVTSGGTGTPAE